MARFSSKGNVDITRCINTLAFKGIDARESYGDWKEPSLRKELFNRYFKWRVTVNDLDHTHYMNVLCKDYDYEQKAWFAFTFGMTYRTPQSFAYTETFPDFHAIDMDELEKWHAENWKRTTYGTDARYNKGHFVRQVQSLKDWVGNKTFKEKFDSVLVGNSQRENFWLLYREVLTLYKFGRMTGWLTMQALHDLLGLPIDPEDIMLDGYSPNNDSSLQSIWNGLCAYENRHDMMVGKYGNYSVTDRDTQWAKESLLEYTSLAEEFAGFKIDSFRKESIWCQYKRLFGEEGSKEYPGHASGDATSRYLYYREFWPEIDWSKFREALRTQPGYVKGATFVDWYNSIFGATGLMINMNEMFDDMPDVYDLFDIDPSENKVIQIWEDDGLTIENVNFSDDLLVCPRYVK